MGMIGSVAGTPLSQAKGTDTEKAAQDTSDQARQDRTDRAAENAAGIGETEQDSETSDRDADGRRLWESQKKSSQEDDDADGQQKGSDSPQSRDPSGQCGKQIDLCG